MTQSNKKIISDKWRDSGILSGIDTKSIDEVYSHNSPDLKDSDLKDFSLLPIAIRVASQTVGLDLVSVNPLSTGLSDDELNKIKNEVIQENRDRKINSVVNDEAFDEMKVEEHPDYKKYPGGSLMYLDYHYGATGV